MLSQYFSFQEEPFGATPNPRWLYLSATHREALASLRYGFHSNRGFTALIAPPGMGKTTLLFQFLNEIRNFARSAFVFDTQCEPLGLLRYILRELEIAPATNSDEMHGQLNDVLAEEARAKRRVVVVIDEAQNLSDEALEMLRLLTNFETPQAKLLQIVLSGQPLLADTLMKPSLEQLRQRVSTICRLEPFSMEETTSYIGHRLEQAGYRGAPLFGKDALERITVDSKGIPRKINNLCFDALSLCCELKQKQVDCSIAVRVIAAQELIPRSREAVAFADGFAAEQSLQLGQPYQAEEPKATAWVTKLLVAATAMVVVWLGLGLLSRSAHWQSWLRLTGYTHSLHTAVLSASITATAPATTNVGRVAVAEPPLKPRPFQITVEPNQTLSHISMRYLGIWDLKRVHQIQALNPHLTDLDHVQAGQKMWLPAPEPALIGQNGTLEANGGDRHEP